MPLKSLCLFLLFIGVSEVLHAEVLRVATYNVQNYLEVDRLLDGRYRPSFPKPEEEKTVLRNILIEVQPDVLILQEMGSRPYLVELQADLKEEGLDLPYKYVA
jgi:hypothetical protein